MSHADWPRNTRNTPLEIRVNVLTCNDMEIVL
jgi:hypothetical protein